MGVNAGRLFAQRGGYLPTLRRDRDTGGTITSSHVGTASGYEGYGHKHPGEATKSRAKEKASYYRTNCSMDEGHIPHVSRREVRLGTYALCPKQVDDVGRQ